jgi:hypothetical protein
MGLVESLRKQTWNGSIMAGKLRVDFRRRCQVLGVVYTAEKAQ